MRYFEIYQLCIDKFFKENNLLVGKEKVKNNSDPVKQYLEKRYPDDKERQGFIAGYLQENEISKERYLQDDSADIDDNKKRIGRWI